MADFVRNEQHRNWPAHSGEIMTLLGLNPGAHLPAEGMPEREIQGVRVWVTPLGDNPLKPIWRRPHRVMCACPICGSEMSLGRLHQHWRKMHSPKKEEYSAPHFSSEPHPSN